MADVRRVKELISSTNTSSLTLRKTHSVEYTYPLVDEQIGDARQILAVYDSAKLPRSVDRIALVDSSRAFARLLPKEQVPRDLLRAKAGTLIAGIEVTAETSKPGELDNDLEIYLVGSPRLPTVVPIYGRVANRVEFSPGVVALPRWICERTSNPCCHHARCNEHGLFENATHGTPQ